MKIKELLKGLNISTEYDDTEVTDITNDSRRVGEGSVFVCIDGTNADGHKYAASAIEKGAGIIICQHSVGAQKEIIVDDTRQVYTEACANFFGNPSRRLHLVGVTGTNGKTTTTYIVKHILEENGFKCGLIGTIQNMTGNSVYEAHNTTPDAYEMQKMFYEMVQSGCTHCVMEVSSHGLAQGRMNGCHYDVAVFTNLTQDHLDYHGTMDNYLMAKRRLFELCDIAVVNADDPYCGRLIDKLDCKVVKYSIGSNEADYTAKDMRYNSDGVRFIMLNPEGEPARVKFPIPGRFSAYNAIGSAVASMMLGIPFEKACEDLATATGVKGRAEVVPTGRDFTVIIDYAHTPDGLVNIISAMRETVEGRLVVLFGCGGDRDKTKRPLMCRAVMEGADFAVITSDNPRTENPSAIIKDILKGTKGYDTPYQVIENRREAIHWAIKNAQPKDVIILAGKGHETYQILNTGTIHFDEREVVREALDMLE
ncbi:MAG: UDP-N-acetylmuramoyl-L-alanyl-D-glutamate--2,6-diaminopimelate ligase [Clostridia bacterium]|nr:UDP-N-acetylmuramoyl-L-alanyl-D-glutamate--2,6-diaminopimelate ligase [Clostridia bacterium]